MNVRRAEPDDDAPIAALLERAGQPPLPPRLARANLLVALAEGGEVAGVIALEVAGRSGLVRTAAVDPDRRRQGLGSSLLRSLLSRANELGLRDLYVLSDDAHSFFGRFGFEEIPRAALPPEIRATRAAREQPQPDGPALRLRLEARFV